MNTIPVIRLEVEHMKHSIVAALSEYTAQIDEDLKNAVDAFCRPENLKRIIEETVNKELKIEIERQVQNFFRYGAGQQAIAYAVTQRLEKSLSGESE